MTGQRVRLQAPRASVSCSAKAGQAEHRVYQAELQEFLAQGLASFQECPPNHTGCALRLGPWANSSRAPETSQLPQCDH